LRRPRFARLLCGFTPASISGDCSPSFGNASTPSLPDGSSFGQHGNVRRASVATRTAEGSPDGGKMGQPWRLLFFIYGIPQTVGRRPIKLVKIAMSLIDQPASWKRACHASTFMIRTAQIDISCSNGGRNGESNSPRQPD